MSAVAALVRAAHPELDAANVVNRIIATAQDAGPPGRDPEFGFGIIDPLAAVTADVPLVDGNPLLDPTPSAEPTESVSSAASPSGETGSTTSAGASGTSVAEDGTNPTTLILVGVAVLVIVVGTIVVLRRRPTEPAEPPPTI